MKNKKSRKPIKIFLADLMHTNNRLGSGYMPLGIGFVASYAKNKFGSEVEVRLFKCPEKLFQALNEDACDILGCSSYIWNSNLSNWACETAKNINPNTLTCQGGTDFPLDYDQRLHYMQKHNYLDIRVIGEGEIAFSNIVELILEKGDRSSILSNEIKGCLYLHKEGGELIVGESSRIEKLESIPYPYSTGLLDEFFDGNFIPIIQTTRGCPFSCNYCAEGNKFYSKIKHFETRTIIDELKYIGERISKTSIVTLQLADTNYGMYKKDKDISEEIYRIKDKCDWPIAIGVSTGKTLDNVIATTEMLKDTFAFSLSVQSMDKGVLDEIGRKNMSPEKYKAASELLTVKRWSTLAETIVPLPNETKDSYLKGILELMDYGAKRIISNTLMCLNGTIYKNEEYMKEFGYTLKYRLLPFQFGIYNGEKVFEYEEVGVSTKDLSIEDYMEINKFMFLVEMLFNSFIFRELELFVKECGLRYQDFIMLAYRELPINASKKVQQVIESLVNKLAYELKDDEATLLSFLSKDDNYEKLINGQIGVNIKFVHKAQLLSSASRDWIEFVFYCLKKFISTNKGSDIKEQMEDLKKFITSKFDGVLDANKTYSSLVEGFNFDILEWLNQEDRTLSLLFLSGIFFIPI